jgi:hypothetical protein
MGALGANPKIAVGINVNRIALRALRFSFHVFLFEKAL